METILSLKNIHKNFDKVNVLCDLSIEIMRGEFISLLGPSGCGKTTTLRCIAGLEKPDSGQIILNGNDVTQIEPNKRSVNTIFQNYALFPHMNVYENIAYGPKAKKIKRAEIKKRVNEMLALVMLEGYEKRMPSQLSGGQCQRVAIARALINNPDVVLLDEPLGALDKKLRLHLQTELKRIQRQVDITFIYVTHDQDEALALSDKIAIMNSGKIEQYAPPHEIYRKPKTKFVTEFVGDRYIFNADVIEKSNGKSAISFFGKRFRSDSDIDINTKVYCSILCDRFILSSDKRDDSLNVTVKDIVVAGSVTKIEVTLPDKSSLNITQYNPTDYYTVGQELFVSVSPEDLVLIKM